MLEAVMEAILPLEIDDPGFIFCVRCGTQNNIIANYCFHCGKKLVKEDPVDDAKKNQVIRESKEMAIARQSSSKKNNNDSILDGSD